MGLLRRWLCRWTHQTHIEWTATEMFTVCSECGTRSDGMPLGFIQIPYVKPKRRKPFWYHTSTIKYAKVRTPRIKHPAVIFDLATHRRKRQA